MEQFLRELPQVFSRGVSPGSERNSLASSQNILFHSKRNGGRIEDGATNVVAPRCMSSPHLFPKAYIDGREQDVKDGVGLIIHRQEQHKQVREHGRSHSHR